MTQNNGLYEDTSGESVKSVLKEKIGLSEIFEDFENLKKTKFENLFCNQIRVCLLIIVLITKSSTFPKQIILKKNNQNKSNSVMI